MRTLTILPIMGTTVKWSEGRLSERCSNGDWNGPWIRGKRPLEKKDGKNYCSKERRVHRIEVIRRSPENGGMEMTRSSSCLYDCDWAP
jgi:hypothetical protein